MTTRVLAKDEWAALSEESGLLGLLPFIPSGDVDVVVVEDDGRIVACWAVMKITHFEGAWIDPEYRGNPGVAIRLLRKVKEVAGKQDWVFTGAQHGDKHVHGLIERLGGVQVPMDTYAVPI